MVEFIDIFNPKLKFEIPAPPGIPPSWTTECKDYFWQSFQRAVECRPFLNVPLYENPSIYVILFIFKSIVVCSGLKRLFFAPWTSIFLFGFLVDYRNNIVDKFSRPWMMLKYLNVIMVCFNSALNVKYHLGVTLGVIFLSIGTFTSPDFFEGHDYCLDVMFCVFSFWEMCRALCRNPFHILYPLAGIAAHQLPRDHPHLGVYAPEMGFLMVYAVIYCVASCVLWRCRVPPQDILFHLTMLFWFACRFGAPPLQQLIYSPDPISVCRRVNIFLQPEPPVATSTVATPTVAPSTTTHKMTLQELFQDLDGAPYTYEEFLSNSLPTMNDSIVERYVM